LFGEYVEEFVVFRGNWVFARPGGFFDFVDYCLAVTPEYLEYVAK